MQEVDYEQLYYDQQYEIRKLKARIKELEEELAAANKGNKTEIQKYLQSEIKKYFNKKEGANERNDNNQCD